MNQPFTGGAGMLGTYWRALKTVTRLNIKKHGIYLLDRPYPESSIMLIKDPVGGPSKGRSTLLLNGLSLVAQGLREGWIEPIVKP